MRKPKDDDGPEDAYVTEEAARLFREGLARLDEDDVDPAVDLLERSADLEGGEGAAVSRSQIVRMLLFRGALDAALGVLDRSAERAPGALWRTVGELLPALVEAGYLGEALERFVAAGEAIRREPDLDAALSSFLPLLQSVSMPAPSLLRVATALREAAEPRLDARLAVERVLAARGADMGGGQPPLLPLARIAHEALVQGVRGIEARAQEAVLRLAAAATTVEDDEDGAMSRLGAPHPIHEQPLAERVAAGLGAGTAAVGRTLARAAEGAAREGEPSGAAALARLACVLLHHGADTDGARRAARSARDHARGLPAVVTSEVDTIEAWMAGALPEPAAPLRAHPVTPDTAEDGPPTPRLVELPEPQDGGARLGGDPLLPAALRWPQCRGCGDPLTFVAELRPPAVRLARHARALVFACNVAPWGEEYESRCAAGSEPDGGGGLLILDGEPPATAGPRLAPFGAPRLEPRGLTPAPEAEPAPADRQPGEADPGGGPAVDPPAAPACPLCGGAQRLLAWIDAASLQIADGGALFAYACPAACGDRGAVIWRPGG